MQKPFLSVIIPAFDEEKYLPKLLSDLQKQKNADFEVIVVDGGSNDKTIELARKFIGHMPVQVLVTNFKNVCKQRNYGAMRATGKYLLFLDADVRLPKDYISKIEKEIMEKPVEFGTTYVTVKSKNIYDLVMMNFINIGADLSALIDQPFVGGWCFLIRQEIFVKTKGFREDIVHGEDAEFSLRLAKKGYEMKVLRKIKLIYSLRRYHSQGRLKGISNNAQAALHLLFKGPITKNIFEYPMGGGWYEKSIKNRKDSAFIKNAKKFMKKFEKVME